jgi:hypothetical protein
VGQQPGVRKLAVDADRQRSGLRVVEDSRVPLRGVARWRPTSFFIRKPKLAQEPTNSIRVRPNAGRIYQRTGQFGHGHVAVLINQFDQKGAMRIKLAFAERATLRRGSGLPSPADRKTPTRPGGRRELQTQRSRTARSTLPQSTSETAPAARLAKVLT